MLFCFLLIGWSTTDALADPLTTSAGVYPPALRQDTLRSGLNWLESLHQLLIDHSRATGQTLRLEFTHEPSVNTERALDRARKGLVGLPIELRQRQEACLIAGFYGENQKGKFDISAIEVECGLSLTHVPVNSHVREIIDSISGKSLGRQAWEAYIFWIGLEILRACGSPVLESQALTDQRIEQFPTTLIFKIVILNGFSNICKFSDLLLLKATSQASLICLESALVSHLIDQSTTI